MLISYGANSSYLNPIDSLHGDIGMVHKGDIVIMFSKSGSTAELADIVPNLKLKGASILTITCSRGSPLEKLADHHVYLPLLRENCPLGVSPVSSSIIQMLFADTLAALIAKFINLSETRYKLNHPAGDIGRSISTAEDLMIRADAAPQVPVDATVLQAIIELTNKGYRCLNKMFSFPFLLSIGCICCRRTGCLTVVADDKKVAGILTDGDIRRLLLSHGDIRSLKVSQVMRDEAILCPGHTLIPGLLSVSILHFYPKGLYIYIGVYSTTPLFGSCIFVDFFLNVLNL